MTLIRRIRNGKLFAGFLLSGIVWLTGCSPAKLPYIVINYSDEPTVVSYRLTDCQTYENYKWRQEYEPLKLGSENYFNADNNPPFAPLAADELSMIEKPLSVVIDGGGSKRQRDCVERNYTIKLPPKTVLQIAREDFSPVVKLDFLEIKSTHSTLRFENTNVWQAFKNIDENNGLLGKDHDAYEISVY